jgi:hypothetical protein
MVYFDYIAGQMNSLAFPHASGYKTKLKLFLDQAKPFWVLQMPSTTNG